MELVFNMHYINIHMLLEGGGQVHGVCGACTHVDKIINEHNPMQEKTHVPSGRTTGRSVGTDGAVAWGGIPSLRQ